jgi:hypothetical protein
MKRVQKWFTVQGTKRDGERKLTELIHNLHRGEYIEPSNLTVGEWLTEWLETAIKPPNKRLRTDEPYQSVIERHLKPAIGHIRLQQLQPTDVKQYYNESALSFSRLISSDGTLIPGESRLSSCLTTSTTGSLSKIAPRKNRFVA